MKPKMSFKEKSWEVSEKANGKHKAKTADLSPKLNVNGLKYNN